MDLANSQLTGEAVWAEATVIYNTNSPSFYEEIFDVACSALKESCDALHADVSTGDEDCCMQMVIPVVTPQQGLNPALAFPTKNTTLRGKTETGGKKYNKAKALMFNIAKNFKIPVFDTKSILDSKDNGQMCSAWVGGSPATPGQIPKLSVLRGHLENKWINIILSAVLSSQQPEQTGTQDHQILP